MAADDQLMNQEMDSKGLYQEEVFTDRRLGTIMRMTPVDGDGNRDQDRDVVYVGQAQIMTNAGALPLSFEIEAGSLNEAAEKFAAGANKAADEMMERLKEMRREAAGGIVLPEGGGGQGGFGGPGGGMPGGGFQLR